MMIINVGQLTRTGFSGQNVAVVKDTLHEDVLEFLHASWS